MKRRNFLKLLGLSVIAPKIGMEIVDKLPKPDEWGVTDYRAFIDGNGDYNLIGPHGNVRWLIKKQAWEIYDSTKYPWQDTLNSPHG